MQAYKQIPAEGDIVPGELVVQFEDGYAPHEIMWEIESRKKRPQLLKPFGLVEDVYWDLIGFEKYEDRLKVLMDNLDRIGVRSFKQLVTGPSSDEIARYYTLFFESQENLPAVQKELSGMHFISSSAPSVIAHVSATPNDPAFSQLWGMTQIKAPQAWDISTGSDSVIVAVIDSGIDTAHPDFAGSLLTGVNYIESGGGMIDDLGHGTHVAGTIGAVGDNGVGVAGVNWRVKILPLRICRRTSMPPAYNECNLNAAVPGIQEAINRGAKVVNMSLGGPGQCSFALQQIISDANESGITVAVAAGNDNANAGGKTPASCNGVITVGASTQPDGRASFSNFGDTVEIAAPGVKIYSTYSNGGYKENNGTSMASPHVAGAAALLLSVNPSLSPSEVRDCLVNNGDPITTDRPIGGVRLNVFKALQECGDPSQIPTATPTLPLGAPTNTPTPTITPTNVPGVPTNTPTPTRTPTPTVLLPTPTPTIGGFRSRTTPIPTPDAYFTCDVDPACIKSGKSLRLCPLICTPI